VNDVHSGRAGDYPRARRALNDALVLRSTGSVAFRGVGMGEKRRRDSAGAIVCLSGEL
jgi:hypothetical protein